MLCILRKIYVIDSIIGTLLKIPGKTKDEIKSRMDLVEMGKYEQFALKQKGQITYLLLTCHTLSKKEKI